MDEKWATATYASAGEVVRWLEDITPGGIPAVTRFVSYSDRWSRRWAEWRRDPRTRIKVETTLDEFLTNLSVPLSAAPDYVFNIEQKLHKKEGKKNLTKKQLRAMLTFARQNGPAAAARKYGITTGAVRYHVRAANKAAGIAPCANRTSPAVDAAVKEWRDSNGKLSYNEAARRHNVSASSIRRRIAKQESK